MADRSSIEWTDATWNPVIGCSKVSPGCDNCYAIGQASRIIRMTEARNAETPYLGTVTSDGADWTGTVKCLPERVAQPLRWKKPRRVFVNSMSDLFHPAVDVDFIVDVWNVMSQAEHHQFQLLTKRPQRMKKVVSAIIGGWAITEDAYDDEIPPNVWLGTSIEDDKYAFRADHLRDTPAAVRWISAEPLLGPLPSLNLEGIDWLVAGGESGPAARWCHPDWVRDLRDRCQEAGVAFFFKQWGAWEPRYTYRTGRVAGFEKVGKRKAGRTLDGRTWDEYPSNRTKANDAL